MPRQVGRRDHATRAGRAARAAGPTVSPPPHTHTARARASGVPFGCGEAPGCSAPPGPPNGRLCWLRASSPPPPRPCCCHRGTVRRARTRAARGVTHDTKRPLTLTAEHARQLLREWERATERHHELQVRVRARAGVRVRVSIGRVGPLRVRVGSLRVRARVERTVRVRVRSPSP